MKSYKEFMAEIYSVPVVDIETTGTDVSLPEIKSELNRNLSLIFRQQFQTLDSAVSKLRKLLAMYNLSLPQINSYETSGTMKIVVGKHNIVWDEFKGELEDYTTGDLKFTYKLIDGLYKCSAELI